MLDKILKYHNTPEEGDFVTGVLNRIRRQQRMRKLILITSGVAGAAFGTTGLLMVSDSISHLMTGTDVLPVSIALVGSAAFLIWLFQDELTLVS